MRAAAWVLLAVACQDYHLFGGGDGVEVPPGDDPAQLLEDVPPGCALDCCPPAPIDITTDCGTEVGSFTPVVEWEVLDRGGSMSQPVVADLDRDGIPEILIVLCPGLNSLVCHVEAHHGDGSGLYATSDVNTAYGDGVAVADLDADGSPEVVVLEFTGEDYDPNDWGYCADQQSRVVLLDAGLGVIWRSSWYDRADFDHSSYPAISDMDHDGTPEIVVGRVILDANGVQKGRGTLGRGGGETSNLPCGFEAAASFPADIDLDGVEEVVTGNALYRPNGSVLLSRTGLDGVPAVGNFDADPEAEIALGNFGALYVLDDDLSLMWEIVDATTDFSAFAIGDLDADGQAELVVASKRKIIAFESDGAEIWNVPSNDPSGATGPSLFDFEGDGIPEVVLADQTDIFAVNGADGVEKWRTDHHDSWTMIDVPTIADVDADGHAEVVVSHWGTVSGFSVYGDQDDSWMGTRPVWNQFAFSNSHINDDLTVPVTAPASWQEHNTFRAALPTTAAGPDLGASLLDVCSDDCDLGLLWLVGVVENRGSEVVPAGTPVALYAESETSRQLVSRSETPSDTPPGWRSEGMIFRIQTTWLGWADSLILVADDDGTGAGTYAECHEDDNAAPPYTRICR